MKRQFIAKVTAGALVAFAVALGTSGLTGSVWAAGTVSSNDAEDSSTSTNATDTSTGSGTGSSTSSGTVSSTSTGSSTGSSSSSSSASTSSSSSSSSSASTSSSSYSGSSASSYEAAPVAPSSSNGAAVKNASNKTVQNNVAIYNETGLPFAVSTSQTDLNKYAKAASDKLIEVRAVKVSEEGVVFLNEEALERGKKVAATMQFGLSVKDSKGNAYGWVTELTSPATFVIQVPNGYDGNKNEFSVLRVHNGKVDELSDLDADPNTITFKTDKFSDYAIIYTAKTDRTPKTSDSHGAFGNYLLFMAGGVGIFAIAAGIFVLNERNRRKRLHL